VTVRSRTRTRWAAIALAPLIVAVFLLVSLSHPGGRRATPPPATAVAAPPWFAPYVDLTLTPGPRFQTSGADPSRHVVLGFIIAGAHSRCTPTWGGVSALGQATALNAQIAQAQTAHERVIVSFGGAAGSDLAVGCTSPAKLEAAYATVVNHYGVSTIDLDVEGPASLSSAVAARRAHAIAALQQDRVTAGKPLAVWLTLTVSPNGLEPSGMSAIQQMLEAGVKLAGVNVLAFDYGPLTGRTMVSASESALTATANQLQTLNRANRIRPGAYGVWSQLGATIMEGHTDIVGQVWTLADARALERFAIAHHLGRLSEWSLGRDAPCSGAPPQPTAYCSGVLQKPLEFSKAFLGRDTS
jgi:chitinase